MVQAVICDQATTNVKALHLLGATLDPQKSIRNTFFKCGLKGLPRMQTPEADSLVQKTRRRKTSCRPHKLGGRLAVKFQQMKQTNKKNRISSPCHISLALPPPTTAIEPMDVELVSDIVEDKTVGDCIQEEGLFYVAGWVVWILQQEERVGAFPDCEVLLLRPTHQDHSYAASNEHPYLAGKKYTPAANLMRPSEEFFVCIQLLEEELTRNIDTFWPHTNVTNSLEMTLWRLGAFNSLLSTHPEHASLLESISIKKSFMCRLGAEIRVRNRALSYK
ncbi:hypothetical protein UPYG_G00109730 [Umbra pygmaea]|uniref:Uncharacterized protein n=1 Tax=Umbra pygmaea TaxID=75934 RepID=A0ABD0X6C1_UMBPY